MEKLISLSPLIFCFWTGILIAWSGVVMYNTSMVIYNVVHMDRFIRNSDIIQLVVVAVGSILLLVALFVTTYQTAFHLDTILFLEVWYSIFLFHISENSSQVSNLLEPTKN